MPRDYRVKPASRDFPTRVTTLRGNTTPIGSLTYPNPGNDVVVSVAIAPSLFSLGAINDSIVLTANPKNSNGQTILGKSVIWSTNASNVVSLTSQSGYSITVTRTSSGSAIISAMVDGIVGNSTLESAGIPAAVVVEDFSTYTDITHFISDPRGIYTAEYAPLTGIENLSAIDTTVGFGSSNRSLRYDFPARLECTDFSIGYNLSLPAPVTEAWLEVYVAFDSHFSVKLDGCTSGVGYKFIFGRVNGDSGRFGIYKVFQSAEASPNTGQWQFGTPNLEGAISPSASTYAFVDGTFHRYRMRMKVQDGGNFATVQGWLDDVMIGTSTNPSTATSIYAIAMGRNLNQGPRTPQSLYWGRIAVWTDNPGWV